MASFLDKLPALSVVQNQRRAITPKRPTVLERRERKAEKQSLEDRQKAACWARDGGKSRASGKPVKRADVTPAKRGEVAHLDARSTAPEKKYALANLVLLTAEEHALSDARTAPGGKPLLTIKGKNANKTLTFTMRNEKGRVLWTRTSAPEVPQTGKATR